MSDEPGNDGGAMSYGAPVIGMSRLALDPDGRIEALNAELEFARTDAAALRGMLSTHASEMAALRRKLTAVRWGMNALAVGAVIAALTLGRVVMSGNDVTRAARSAGVLDEN